MFEAFSGGFIKVFLYWNDTNLFVRLKYDYIIEV